MARAFEKEPSTRNWKMSLAYISCSMFSLKIKLTTGAAVGISAAGKEDYFVEAAAAWLSWDCARLVMDKSCG